MVLRPDRLLVLLLAFALLACGRSETPPSDSLPAKPVDLSELGALTSAPPSKRAVILAVDGLGAAACGQVLTQPRLAALVAKGCRGLGPGAGGRASAWATLVAGAAPGEHGVFADSEPEFWAPDPGTGRTQWGQGPRRAPPFWSGPSGPLAVVLGVPDDFPPTPVKGARQVVGAGLPGPQRADAPGFAVGFSAGAGLRSLVGTPTPAGMRFDLPAGLSSVPLLVRDGRIRQEAEGQSVVTLVEGAWSEPLELHLEGARRTKAWTRAWTVSLEPLRVFIQPLSADATAPWLPLSHPTSAALELQRRVGRFRTADRSADRAAVEAGILPRSAYEQDLLVALEGRIAQAAWALERWDPALVLLALPELAELLPRPAGRERGLDVIEAALSRIAAVAGDAELTLGSVRGLAVPRSRFDPSGLPHDGAVRFGPHGAVRLGDELSPARARSVIEELAGAVEAEPLIARVERRADWTGPRAGLAPDLRLVGAEGVAVAPGPWAETQGVVMGPLAHPEGPALADLGSVTMSRLVSE